MREAKRWQWKQGTKRRIRSNLLSVWFNIIMIFLRNVVNLRLTINKIEILNHLLSLVAHQFVHVEFRKSNICFDFFHCACLEKTTTNIRLSKFNMDKLMSYQGHWSWITQNLVSFCSLFVEINKNKLGQLEISRNVEF